MKERKFANSNLRREIINKCNAFTLIELLAIIVILAIIAVITVPIILNIIDNSSEGAAKDSAYGYKDAISKYYLTKLVADSSQQSPSGVKYVSEIKNDGLTISGQEPTEGWVNLDKGQVISYSLKFGDYVVTYDESTQNPVSTKNGIIKDAPGTIPSCPGCVFAYYTSIKYIKGTEGKTDNQIKIDDIENKTRDYTTLNRNAFLGHILDSEGKIERAFACGIYNDKPFCIEGTKDGSKYEENRLLITSEELWNDTCSGPNGVLYCPGAVHARIAQDGTVNIHYNGIYGCSIYNEMNGYTYHNGYVGCIESS